MQDFPLGLAIIIGAAILGIFHAVSLIVLGVFLMSALSG